MVERVPVRAAAGVPRLRGEERIRRVEGSPLVSLILAASSDWRPGAAPTPVLP